MQEHRYVGHDRRKFRRLDINISVSYDIRKPLIKRVMLGDKEIEATTLDLSVGGISFVTNYNIPVGTILAIKFILSRLDERAHHIMYGPIEIIGEVCYNITGKADTHRLGIAFREMKEKDRATIDNFIKIALSPGPII